MPTIQGFIGLLLHDYVREEIVWTRDVTTRPRPSRLCGHSKGLTVLCRVSGRCLRPLLYWRWRTALGDAQNDGRRDAPALNLLQLTVSQVLDRLFVELHPTDFTFLFTPRYVPFPGLSDHSAAPFRNKLRFEMNFSSCLNRMPPSN